MLWYFLFLPSLFKKKRQMEKRKGQYKRWQIIIHPYNKVILITSILYVNKINSIYPNIIICFIQTPFLTLSSQPFIRSPLKLQNFTTPNKSQLSVCCVCVCSFGISFTYVIESIELKLISVCLNNVYSLIA